MLHFVNTERSDKVVIYFESSSICVSPGFCGLTGISPVVRPAASGGQTGGARAVRPAATSVGSRRSWRFDRSIYIGQIDVYQAVRPAHPLRSDHDPSISRVTFISAKSFRFLGIPTIHPPSSWLRFCVSILQRILTANPCNVIDLLHIWIKSFPIKFNIFQSYAFFFQFSCPFLCNRGCPSEEGP